VKIKYNSAFGLPKGTIRATITIILIGVTFFLGMQILGLIGTLTSEQTKNAMIIFSAFTTLSSLMIGSYIAKK